MNRLDDIAVTVEYDGKDHVSGQSLAVLSEIANLLENLARTGESSSIDVRSLPLFPGDYAAIRETLGTGEVSARINALGPTQIQETAIPGVWWVTHFNDNEETLAEFIEITVVPEIIPASRDDLATAREQLQSLIRERQQSDHSL